eukprot:CAMPEP_0172480382 /NCGR_PEP_ID=MMETSP1066-20121228/5478_1 /TAXON_ID=671091 /ORGANISM="Coscinodiscus wailesii, Strain CCMP2513" /LENGTH=694 /DNA_ID=CAMNT_0013241629 /DNA_START=83 /DNA_END=2167 /DNA_ORIENTATION=-
MSGQFERVSALKRSSLILLALSLLAIVSTLYLYDDMQYEVSGVVSDSRVLRMLKKRKNKKKKKKQPESGRKKRRKERKKKNRPTKAPLPKRNLIWLLGYPGSGSDEVLRMVEEGTGRSMATNYGNELFFQGDRRYKRGPFKNNEKLITGVDSYDDDQMPFNVLVKTQCSGYCLGQYCNGKTYMKNLVGKASRFNSACATGMSYNTKFGRMLERRAYTKDNDIEEVVVVVRNPVTMLGARMANEKGLSFEKMTHGDFIGYCTEMDNKYGKVKEIRKLMGLNPSIKDAANGVPCYTEFLRIVSWYKNAFELASNKMKKLVIRWENLVNHDEHWVNEISNKFNIDGFGKWAFDASAEKKNNKFLVQLTKPEEYEKIMMYIKTIVTPSDWEELYEVYADRHPRSGPQSIMDFLHVKNFNVNPMHETPRSRDFYGTLEECEVACQVRNWCKSFDFFHGKDKCNLFDSKPEYDELQSNNEGIDHYTVVMNHQHMHFDPNNYDADDDDYFNDFDIGDFEFDDDIIDDDIVYKVVNKEAKGNSTEEQKVEEYEGTVKECQMQCFMLSWCKTFDYRYDEGKCILRGKYVRKSKLTSNSGTQDHFSMVYDPQYFYSVADTGVKKCEDMGWNTILDVDECDYQIREYSGMNKGHYGGTGPIGVEKISDPNLPYGCLIGADVVNVNMDSTGVVTGREELLCQDGPH